MSKQVPSHFHLKSKQPSSTAFQMTLALLVEVKWDTSHTSQLQRSWNKSLSLTGTIFVTLCRCLWLSMVVPQTFLWWLCYKIRYLVPILNKYYSSMERTSQKHEAHDAQKCTNNLTEFGIHIYNHAHHWNIWVWINLFMTDQHPNIQINYRHVTKTDIYPETSRRALDSLTSQDVVHMVMHKIKIGNPCTLWW